MCPKSLPALILLYFSCVICGFAQDASTAAARTVSIKFSPQHLFINGLVLDVEKNLRQDSRHGLVLSPSFYKGKTRTVDFFADRDHGNNDSASVLGYGAALQHRIYTNKATHIADRRGYFAYGINYHRFNVAFYKPGWVAAIDPEDLEYYTYRERAFSEKINRIGATAVVGLQLAGANNRFLFDVYVGGGYKKSFTKTDYSYARYNRSPMDFGYTGLYYTCGFKIGTTL